MKKYFSYILLFFVVNIFTLLVAQVYVYDYLDDIVANAHDSKLENVGREAQAFFHDEPANRWPVLAKTLSYQLGSRVVVINRADTNIDPAITSLFELGTSKHMIKDIKRFYVYPFIDENNVLAIGPLPVLSFYDYITEWTSWFLTVLVNLSLLIYMLSRQSKEQREYKHNVLQQIHILEEEKQKQIDTKRDLMYGIAHEFRSPLAFMQFAMELLDKSDDPIQVEARQKLDTGLTDLGYLVSELLSYSRIKDSLSPLKKESNDIAELCQIAINKTADFYPKITFDLKAQNNCLVWVEPTLFTRALINLVRNAGRYAQKQCLITVTIENTTLTVSIEDDGPGIPPGKRERIFEPFTRLDNSRSRDSGGTGLGLAIVQSIVDKHKGDIYIDDSRLGGACFTMTLPLKISN